MNYHPQELAKGIQMCSNNSNYILLMGDFSAEVSDISFASFPELYEVGISRPATKTLQNPLCIDLFLTNSQKKFKKTKVI